MAKFLVNLAHFVLITFILFILFSALKAWQIHVILEQERKQQIENNACYDVQHFYGVAADSPKSHARLPEGVKIVEKDGKCFRDDTMTELTGNEMG